MRTKVRNKSRALLRATKWLLVQTTDYVKLESPAYVHIEEPGRWHPRVQEVESSIPLPDRPSPESGLYRHHDEDGTPYVTRGKNGQRLTDEQVEQHMKRRAAQYERAMARYDRARAKRDKAVGQVLAQLKREARANPDTARFKIGSAQNPVLGRNLTKRVRLMRASHADQLYRIDSQIARLQARRKAVLLAAWDRGVPVTATDLATLADLSESPARRAQRKRYAFDRALDHNDTVWPPRAKPRPDGQAA